MVIDFKELVNLCEDELTSREYTWHNHNKVRCEWKYLLQWLNERGCSGFNEEIGLKYCDETFGTHILNGLLKKNDKIRLRAVRMLISYQKDGDFEFRTPRIEKYFVGNTGRDMVHYLTHLRETLHFSEDTINNKKFYLYTFNNYLENHLLTFYNLSIDIIEDFYKIQNYKLSRYLL